MCWVWKWKFLHYHSRGPAVARAFSFSERHRRRSSNRDEPAVGTSRTTPASMSSAAWIVARRAQQSGGRSATVAFGDAAIPIIGPGKSPQQVTMFAAKQRTDAFVQAVQAVDGVLTLSTGTGAKLLVVVSDERLPSRDLMIGQRQIRPRLFQA